MRQRESCGVEPLVSVIITCYNQGHFIGDAIRSVSKQNYDHIEIVVIDDGSTDDTPSAVLAFPEANYFFQPNAGLSAARNTGIEKSSGSFLVFLDADDWLYPDAIRTNLEYLHRNPRCAFVSGWHDKVDEWGYPLEDQDEQEVVTDCHYLRLLWGNYIGMHATVMYQRWVFNDLRFDTSLKACEDYDMYFKISRKFRVGNHAHKLAAYRIHKKCMSSNIALMLKHVLLVCNRQRPWLKNKAELDAHSKGLKIWTDYYSDKLYRTLAEEAGDSAWPGMDQLALLAKEKPMKCLNVVAKKINHSASRWVKDYLPEGAMRFLHHRGYYPNYVPAPGKVNAGDFKRLTPFSNDFGFDRGGAIDRFYIENFMNEHSCDIRGTVLEIGDNEYTMKFGRNAVKQSDILHVDSTNAKATVVGDITHVPQIPTGYFDCIILTQTLQLIYDVKSALQTCYRILKPGGSLLLTVPGISQIDQGAWKNFWLWSFTDTAMRKLMTDTFNGSSVDIKTYGNVYSASAFLYGMGLSEFPKDYLLHNDPAYQVIISVRAIKL